jgi:hypothetical protein
LCETARWRKIHARPAIRYLIDEGRIVREPTSGQLKADTLLRPKN